MERRFCRNVSQWMGGCGDALFFAISAWFLCDEQLSINKNLRRIWNLEKQILFYSLGILVICVCLANIGIHHISSWSSLAIQSALPIITCLWWYPMSYMLFLLIHPYLTIGLKSLQYSNHRNLGIILILTFSIVPMIKTRTGVLLDAGWNLMLFIFLYIIISYIRWYIPEKLTVRNGRNALLIGLSIAFISVVALSRVHIPQTYPILWMNSPRCLPSLFMALGLFTLALNCDNWQSTIVNNIASCTLAPYLIWSHPEIGSAVDGFVNKLPYQNMKLVAAQAGIGIMLLCAGLIVDLIRQFIFRFTINRHPYRWFDKITICNLKFVSRLTNLLTPNI